MSINIILPVYNSNLTLKRCLNSIYSQTLVDWKLIIIDDEKDEEEGSMEEHRHHEIGHEEEDEED